MSDKPISATYGETVHPDLVEALTGLPAAREGDAEYGWMQVGARATKEAMSDDDLRQAAEYVRGNGVEGKPGYWGPDYTFEDHAKLLAAAWLEEHQS